jgi:hypothetical protein
MGLGQPRRATAATSIGACPKQDRQPIPVVPIDQKAIDLKVSSRKQ